MMIVKSFTMADDVVLEMVCHSLQEFVLELAKVRAGGSEPVDVRVGREEELVGWFYPGERFELYTSASTKSVFYAPDWRMEQW